MSLQEPTTTGTAKRSRWLWIAVVAAVIAGLAALGVWYASSDEETVAAEDAKIELTFTGDEATYVGDREIVEGPAEVVFVNESDDVAILVLQRFDTGSAELATELGQRPEGSDFDATGDHSVPPGEVLLMPEVSPGSQTWPVQLTPGTYFIEAADATDAVTHVWRAAVIEVVPN